MSITNTDLQRVSQADLEALIENEVSEGILIDYKLDLYEPTGDGNRKFLKHVSSFANTAGGHIIIGMDERGGLPTNLIGVEGDLDAQKQRLESLLRDRIEPRILGVGMQPVALSGGRNALVIRIPKSWNPPHAVVNHTRIFYARNSAGAHHASVDELRPSSIEHVSSIVSAWNKFTAGTHRYNSPERVGALHSTSSRFRRSAVRPCWTQK
jgi:predicted HTH transcriptional regulator